MAKELDFDPKNPFGEEQPKIVHFEKNESHYEYCRMQMYEIEHIHRRTFIANMVLCLFACVCAVFGKYISGFSILARQFVPLETSHQSGAILGAGICVILAAMLVIVAGYLAWANFHTLNIFLMMWYVLVVLLAIGQRDYLSAIIGVIGFAFYFISLQAMRKEGGLSQMEGYPDFHEKFDLEKSDIVIQTLMAHKGEKHERASFFTGKTSLRKKKKTAAAEASAAESQAADSLAAELSKQLHAAKEEAAQNTSENQ